MLLGTGLVLDDDGLAEPLRQPLADDAPEHVQGRSRRIRDDELHGRMG
jgi:hypothetical protein